MNLPGFTADLSIYKSKRTYSTRGTIGISYPSQVEPAIAMYPGWGQMLPFIDPFWDWRFPSSGYGWDRAECEDFCREDCVTQGHNRGSSSWYDCVSRCIERLKCDQLST
jgi:hypothetical protein